MSTEEHALELLWSLVDPDPCEFDHNHSCQAHYYFYIDPGEMCPHEEAKRLLTSKGISLDADKWPGLPKEGETVSA